MGGRLVGTIVFFICTVICCHGSVNDSKDSFTEELFIKPLPTGHLYSYFQFTTKWDVNPEETKCKHFCFHCKFFRWFNQFSVCFSEALQLVSESTWRNHRETFNSGTSRQLDSEFLAHWQMGLSCQICRTWCWDFCCLPV